jgi:hypothetical protein
VRGPGNTAFQHWRLFFARPNQTIKIWLPLSNKSESFSSTFRCKLECRSPLGTDDFLRGVLPRRMPAMEAGSAKVFLAIYGNGSANKKPGSGSSVQLDYEFYCRYLDGLAEFFAPSHEHTLIAADAQPECC